MLIPDYMEEFRCIGSDCPDSCCQGWTVAIDQPTYRKYRKVTDPALRERLHRHVVRNRNGARSADQFARIRLDKTGACPFLTEERLCEIQSRLGAAALSHTCRTYPRTVNRVDGVPEMSATLSCPEVARLALLREAGIEFKEVEGQAEAVNRQIQSQGDGSLAAHFWDMRIFAIQTLKDRRFPVWQRLLLVGFATRRLQEAVDGGRLAEIPAILASYRAQIDDGSLAAQIEAIPLRHDIQLGMLKALMGHKLTRIHNARFRACHERFLAGFGDLSGDDLAALGERFQAALAQREEAAVPRLHRAGDPLLHRPPVSDRHGGRARRGHGRGRHGAAHPGLQQGDRARPPLRRRGPRLPARQRLRQPGPHGRAAARLTPPLSPGNKKARAGGCPGRAMGRGGRLSGSS